MKYPVFVLCAVTVAACATSYQPAYVFNEILVHNLAGDTIRGVSLRVAASSKSLACAEIAKNAICRDRFGKRRYPLRGIELSWTHADGNRRSETVNPHIPAYFPNTFALRIVIEILEDGALKPYYEQEDPGRGGSFFESMF